MEDYEVLNDVKACQLEDTPNRVNPGEFQLSEYAQNIHDQASLTGSFSGVRNGLDILKILDLLDGDEGFDSVEPQSGECCMVSSAIYITCYFSKFAEYLYCHKRNLVLVFKSYCYFIVPKNYQIFKFKCTFLYSKIPLSCFCFTYDKY